ncbi:hypothetical protein GCM10009817_11530 [Terrabacter lapilli]|uniref:DUF6504 domain-containing protein n=1 Tax=Terrabacter lapilli TaxID=436231 RepID=A0ABN2RQ69_9MICO
MVRRFSDSVQVRLRERQQCGVTQHVGSAGSVGPAGQLGSAGRVGPPGAGVAEAFEGGLAGPPPEAFIWRGRLYVVRRVLAQWRERRAWWHDALEADEGQVRPGETLVAAASEQHVWRVEASPGWSFASGVYDLAHDESPRGDRWSLVRVAD